MTTTKRPEKAKKRKRPTDQALRDVFWSRVIGLMDSDFDTEGLWHQIAEVSGDPDYDEAIDEETDRRYRALAGGLIDMIDRLHPGASKRFPRRGTTRR